VPVCDAATSYAWAQLVRGEVTATAVLDFLQRTVRPTYRRAGWTLRRVLTDGGKEFKGDFAAGCARLRVRHTRTKPRHAWTNGFVERLQGTILHEHWRIAFRRQYFIGVRALHQSLARFLVFYNQERTRRGIGFAVAHRPQSYGAANAWMGVSTPLRNWTL
jgi:transposase InsO family protein